MIKVGLLGADGSMGRLILGLAFQEEDMKIVSAFTLPDSPNLGMDIGLLTGSPLKDVTLSSVEDLGKLLDETSPDVVVDFTVAEATEKNARIVLERAIPMVIGTTGLSNKFIEELNQ